MIKSIKLSNFLSFGNESPTILLNPLNVVIGPNGSGKSNLIEAITLLRSAPREFLAPIRDGGGIRDWLWKGVGTLPKALIDVVFSDIGNGVENLRYILGFTEKNQRFVITDEKIEKASAEGEHENPYIYYRFDHGQGVLNIKDEQRRLQREEIDPVLSILAQRKDPVQYPELTRLGDILPKIRLYRDWSFGRYTIPRLPQKADGPNDFLKSDCSNLGLVLNSLAMNIPAKKRLLEALQELYDGIDGYQVHIEGGTVQVFLQEGDVMIPATRLSDGTLRYLCLLTILCHPNPPPLVCIEEPELGLHPDVLPALADLMKEASQRCQLVVTTHSDILVDAMTDQPESILVAEKKNGSTSLTRLKGEKLKPWLERYRLGQLWIQGEIGGTRW